VVGLER